MLTSVGVCLLNHSYQNKICVLKIVVNALNFRKRKDWDVFEPIVDILSNEEVEALEAKEDRIPR